MSWLYIPPETLPEPQTHACTASRSAPEPEGSTSGFQSLAPGIALFVTSSGKPMLRPSSWRGWKTRPWIARLSGTMLEPSMAARGVEQWISSRADIRASRFPLRANARVLMIPAICGHTSPGSSANANPNGCFWKTSPIISTSDIARSEASWKIWATGLRKDSLRRQKLAHRINVNGCSSLPDGEHVNWPTPRASANENRQTKPTPSQLAGKHGMNLATTAAMWPTPQTDSFRSRGGDRKHEKGLDGMARDWPTPMATDGNKPSAGNRKTADLTHASRMWMTPTARDHKDGATSLVNTPVNGLLGRQVLVTPTAGSDTCEPRRTLNPAFVEALMGWPTGWTGFVSAATAWCRWLRRMRFEFCRLGSLGMNEAAA